MSRSKKWTRGARDPVGKDSQLALLFCDLLGIASVLLVLSGAMASFNANASNSDDRSAGQVHRKAPQETVWIPEGTFLMGTDDKESFPNERPAHLVQVRGFWMDEHDVTNAEFSKFVEATGYVTTAHLQLERWSLLLRLDQSRSMTCRLGGVGCVAQTSAIRKGLRALVPARDEGRRPIQARSIRAFGACSLETTAKLFVRLEASLLSQNRHRLTNEPPKNKGYQT